MMKKIMIIAGETSGDQHASEVVKKLNGRHSGVKFCGIGGQAMRDAGVDTFVDIREMAVMGIFEVLTHLPVILNAYQKVKTIFKTQKIDLLILVDYAGFNLKVAKLAKAHKIPVLFYISPKIWAWKAGRIKKIQRYVDHMAVILPFEVDIYRKANVPVTYVGSPTAESIHCELGQAQAKKSLSIIGDKPVVGLLPGSRMSEISRLIPLFLKTVPLFPEVQFVLALAPNLTLEDIKPYVAELNAHHVLIAKSQTARVIRASDAVVCASGTATLEVALLNTPMLVVYKMFYPTFLLARLLVKIHNVSLCNIVAGKRIVEELIQYQATPARIANELRKLLYDQDYQARTLGEYRQLQDSLKTAKNAAENVAVIAEKMLD